MGSNLTTRVRVAAIGTLIAGAILAAAAFAQSPPAGGDKRTPAERAIDYRQAMFTVIGGNFGPIGGMQQGRAPFNGTEALKRAQRVAALSGFLEDAFPDISKEGDTRAKPEIWADRAEFDKLVKDFNTHTAALAATLAKDSKSEEAFKTAATAVAGDCKGCHDKFRTK